MATKAVSPLADYFKDIKDPRIERNKRHRLLDVIVVSLLAILCGAEGWEDIERYGRAKKEWLKKFLLLENGIPSHDVYRRVFNRLIPEQIEQCFLAWIRSIKSDIPREVIAIDGKTIRGSFNRQRGLKAAHLVSAWASENRLVFAQVKVDEKSNEITAIPELLSMIALKGCIVTIDAMGCQYAIADRIVWEEADYLFSLKGNQSGLHDDVVEYFRETDLATSDEDVRVHRTMDVDHGRIETRIHAVTADVAWLTERHAAWHTIRSIGMIEGRREIGDSVTTDRRYYLSSLPADPELFATAARSHWGIENSLHYVLDVAFREDACRIKSGHAPENLAFIRKMAMTLVRSDTESKSSLKGRLKNLAWSNDYLEKLLFRSVFADNSPPQAQEMHPV